MPRSSFTGFKPHQIKAFLTVAEHLSIRAAAKALFVSQPAVTRTLRELEAELQAPLLVRGTTGVELTDYGRAFQVRARRLVEESRRAHEDLEQIRDGLTGLVRVGVSSLPAMVLLPSAFLEFRRQMPKAQLQCVDGQLPAALPLLRSGELDFLLTQVMPDYIEDDLHHEVLFTSPVAVCARSGHPRFRCRSLAALADDEWIGWSRSMIDAVFKNNGHAPPQRIAISRSFEATRALVEQTDLISLFSLPLVERELLKHGIRPVKVKDTLPQLSISVVTLHDTRLTPAAQKFLDLARAAAAAFTPGPARRTRTA